MSTADEHAAPAEAEAEPPRRVESQRPGPRSLIGRVLSDRYKIERLLGEGGMGAVYAAEHSLMRKRVAVKVLHPDMTRMKEVVARFEREAMAAAHIEHPNVAAATDFGKLDDGSFFLVLEYVEGMSLRAALEPGRFEVARALHVTRQLAGALVRAHALGIVHRDLKPENVMLVARDGDPDFVKVLDFGIAKIPVGEAQVGGPPSASGPALTQLGMVYGTPEYMPPEQALGLEIDARADLYSVGVMLYEMLTGERPFVSDNPVALLGMHVNAPVPRMSEKAPDANIPADVVALVDRLLEKDVALRVQSAKELFDLLPRTPGAVPPSPVSSPTAMAKTAVGLSAAQPAAAGLPPAVEELLQKLRSLPRPAALAGLGAVALLVLMVVTVSISYGRAHPSKDAALAVVNAAAGSAAPGADPRLRDAVALEQSGDHAKAIELLTALPDADRKLPEARRALATAYAATDRWPDCMRALGPWLEDEPAIATDPKVRALVKEAATSGDDVASALALGLLERHMGPTGLDDLYELAYAPKRPATALRERARKALREPELRARMGPALAITVEIHAAGSTCKVKELFPRAQSDGDERTIAALKPLAARAPVGLLGMYDGLQCIHDGSLTKTIAAIEARIK